MGDHSSCAVLRVRQRHERLGIFHAALSRQSVGTAVAVESEGAGRLLRDGLVGIAADVCGLLVLCWSGTRTVEAQTLGLLVGSHHSFCERCG